MMDMRIAEGHVVNLNTTHQSPFCRKAPEARKR